MNKTKKRTTNTKKLLLISVCLLVVASSFVRPSPSSFMQTDKISGQACRMYYFSRRPVTMLLLITNSDGFSGPVNGKRGILRKVSL